MTPRTRHHPARRYDAETCRQLCFDIKTVSTVRAKLASDEGIRRIGATLEAMAHPTRLKILYSLRVGGELCVCDVAHVLGMGISAVSHQLRRLRDRGLVKKRSDGKMVYYRLDGNPRIRQLLSDSLRLARDSDRRAGGR